MRKGADGRARDLRAARSEPHTAPSCGARRSRGGRMRTSPCAVAPPRLDVGRAAPDSPPRLQTPIARPRQKIASHFASEVAPETASEVLSGARIFREFILPRAVTPSAKPLPARLPIHVHARLRIACATSREAPSAQQSAAPLTRPSNERAAHIAAFRSREPTRCN